MLKDRIRELRLARGWNQTELAAHAGLRQGTIANLETGARDNPTRDTLDKLAAGLGITVQELLGDDEAAGPFPAGQLRAEGLADEQIRRYGALWPALGRADRVWLLGQLRLFARAETQIRRLEAQADLQARSAAETETDPPVADEEPDPVPQYAPA